jgi:hypothetical protein
VKYTYYICTKCGRRVEGNETIYHVHITAEPAQDDAFGRTTTAAAAQNIQSSLCDPTDLCAECVSAVKAVMRPEA